MIDTGWNWQRLCVKSSPMLGRPDRNDQRSRVGRTRRGFKEGGRGFDQSISQLEQSGEFKLEHPELLRSVILIVDTSEFGSLSMDDLELKLLSPIAPESDLGRLPKQATK